MNFLAPQMLLGLLLVPVAIGFYLWAQRRRSRYAVRFTNLDLLANLAPRRPSWRRHEGRRGVRLASRSRFVKRTAYLLRRRCAHR